MARRVARTLNGKQKLVPQSPSDTPSSKLKTYPQHYEGRAPIHATAR